MTDSLIDLFGHVFPVVTLLIGSYLGYRSAARVAAEQRFEDRRQRWRERRQELLWNMQIQARIMAEEAGTAIVMRNTGENVDREAPWFLRWNEARRQLGVASDILDDPQVEKRFVVFRDRQDEVARTEFPPVMSPKGPVMDTPGVRDEIASLDKPLTDLTDLLAEKYRGLEGPEPTMPKTPWWKPL